ncbi:MAG: hypothetical protein ACSHX6_05730 [Akkermansiaceae bacterium]
MKHYLIFITLIALAMFADAQDEAKKVSDPDGLCSIDLPEGWSLVAEDKRAMPKRPAHLAVSSEWMSEDKSRVVLLVLKKAGFPKGEKKKPLSEMVISLVTGLAGGSDAKAIREGGRGRMGGLDSSHIHMIQSKGKLLIENHLSMAEDEKYYYVVIGSYRVEHFRRRGVEIARMVQSFELGK